MQIRIEANHLPGRQLAGYDDIHVGVQRRGRPAELLALHAGDQPVAAWTLDCATTVDDAGVDVTGPYVQGSRGERFVYLSWVARDAEGTLAMFRRAKLMMQDIDPEVLGAAVLSGLLVGRLRLTDATGLPLCARVRSPVILWVAG